MTFHQKINIVLSVVLSFIIIVIATLFLLGIINRVKKPTVQPLPDEEKTYDTFSTPVNDIEALKNKEIVGLIYFGRDSCSECLTINQILGTVAKENNTLPIYKFDTDYWRENKDFEYILDLYEVSSVPSIVYVTEDKTFESLQIIGETGEAIYQNILSVIEQ